MFESSRYVRISYFWSDRNKAMREGKDKFWRCYKNRREGNRSQNEWTKSLKQEVWNIVQEVVVRFPSWRGYHVNVVVKMNSRLSSRQQSEEMRIRRTTIWRILKKYSKHSRYYSIFQICDGSALDDGDCWIVNWRHVILCNFSDGRRRS